MILMEITTIAFAMEEEDAKIREAKSNHISWKLGISSHTIEECILNKWMYVVDLFLNRNNLKTQFGYVARNVQIREIIHKSFTNINRCGKTFRNKC